MMTNRKAVVTPLLAHWTDHCLALKTEKCLFYEKHMTATEYKTKVTPLLRVFALSIEIR